MSAFLSEKTLLALFAAAGYGTATILIKLLADRTEVYLAVVLAGILLATVVAEMLLLRQVALGLAYVAIMATETALVLTYAYLVGEGLSAREWLGASFVFIGICLVSF